MGTTEPQVAKRMSRQLNTCQNCLEVYDRLPPPTYYSLGRPVPINLLACRTEPPARAETFYIVPHPEPFGVTSENQ
jgi:hypothetical protein